MADEFHVFERGRCVEHWSRDAVGKMSHTVGPAAAPLCHADDAASAEQAAHALLLEHPEKRLLVTDADRRVVVVVVAPAFQALEARSRRRLTLIFHLCMVAFFCAVSLVAAAFATPFASAMACGLGASLLYGLLSGTRFQTEVEAGVISTVVLIMALVVAHSAAVAVSHAH